ncbi:MAG: glycosyltransferase [bacterium]|nr:glycosyltransferase [bacterium]
MSKFGIDVCFIRDCHDRFAFGLPVWEDVPFTLNYEEVRASSGWGWSRWERLENEVGWRAPVWMRNPIKKECLRGIAGVDPLELIEDARLKEFYMHNKKESWSGIISLMRDCDALLVCGVWGAIFAMMSKKPFIILPHGRDLRLALGLASMHAPEFDWVIRQAFREASFIGQKINGWNDKSQDVADTFSYRRLHLPFACRERLGKEARRVLLAELFEKLRLPLPRAEYIGFIPSRIDYKWKGLDKFFKAYSRLENRGGIHLIASGWGDNYPDARRDFGGENVTFLPCAFSKPLLFDFYRACDFAVDQFELGIYGTSACEAMSCGTPVLMWIDNELYARKGGVTPPVLNARSERDILALLKDILSGKSDLEAAAGDARKYVKEVHDEEQWVKKLAAYFEGIINPNERRI